MPVTPTSRASQRLIAKDNITVGQDGFAAGCAAAILHHTLGNQRSGRREIAVSDLAANVGVVLSALRALAHAQLVEIDHPDPGVIVVHTSAGQDTIMRVLAEHFGIFADLASHWSWTDYEQIVTEAGTLAPHRERAKAHIRAAAQVPSSLSARADGYIDGIHDTIVLPRLQQLTDQTHASIVSRYPDLAERVPSRRFCQVYGLTGSYAQPMLALARRPTQQHTPEGFNAQVDRALNVIASGAAHRTYFLAAQSILRKLFDDPNTARQPAAVVDTGCGDGTWLREIHRFVRTNTARAHWLERLPVHLVGVDLSPVAVQLTRQAIQPLGGQAFIGDIGDPEQIVAAVSDTTGVARERQLHIRAFIDHNRSLPAELPSMVSPSSLGPFALTPDGGYVSAAQVTGDWISHLSRWGQTLGAGTAVIIEAHTSPKVTPVGFGFEFYHTLSGQSPLSWLDFATVVRQSGLGFLGSPRLFASAGFTNVSVSCVSGNVSERR